MQTVQQPVYVHSTSDSSQRRSVSVTAIEIVHMNIHDVGD